jgi:hypothetical protein
MHNTPSCFGFGVLWMYFRRFPVVLVPLGNTVNAITKVEEHYSFRELVLGQFTNDFLVGAALEQAVRVPLAERRTTARQKS